MIREAHVSASKRDAGHKILQNGPRSFSVEGFFREVAGQRFRSASGFKTVEEAHQWVYAQQTQDAEDKARGGKAD